MVVGAGAVRHDSGGAAIRAVEDGGWARWGGVTKSRVVSVRVGSGGGFGGGSRRRRGEGWRGGGTGVDSLRRKLPLFCFEGERRTEEEEGRKKKQQ